MQQARAFVFAAEEDFGIAMVEAQACGTPVIAFGRGVDCGALMPVDLRRPIGQPACRGTPVPAAQAEHMLRGRCDVGGEKPGTRGSASPWIWMKPPWKSIRPTPLWKGTSCGGANSM